jgi:NADH-quinone oxidoreductase subunit A
MEAALPIFLFIIVASAVPFGMLAAGLLLGPRRSGEVKRMPYESGMDPIHDTRRRFDVRFHLVAIAFLIFDVELLFLYPWAVATKHPNGIDQSVAEGLVSGRPIVFAGVMFFLTLVVVGLVYEWRKGVLKWR